VNRNTRENCRRCVYGFFYNEPRGQCLRYPPVWVDPEKMWMRPAISEIDSCGEFRVRDEAIDVES
jgi:hypothetical protein